jgi:hypothetical protein
MHQVKKHWPNVLTDFKCLTVMTVKYTTSLPTRLGLKFKLKMQDQAFAAVVKLEGCSKTESLLGKCRDRANLRQQKITFKAVMSHGMHNQAKK